MPKGAALIAAALAGWLLGGIVVYFGLVLRLRRRVRTLARELSVAEKSQRETVMTPVTTRVVIQASDKAP